MTAYYLRSTDGSDASDGLTWANAFATMAYSLTQMSAGDTLYVSDAHVEGASAYVTLTSPGTAASPCSILCVDDTADPEPPTALASTAVVDTTVGSIDLRGYAYCYGVSFKAGTSSSPNILFYNPSALWWKCERCEFWLRATSSTQNIRCGQTSGTHVYQHLEWIDCVVNFAQANHYIAVGPCDLEWRGGSFAGTVSTTLLADSTFVGSANINGVDLSTFSNTLVAAPINSTHISFENCKLHASVTLSSTPAGGASGPKITMVNCDSGSLNYRYERQAYEGAIYHEATIVRTGGASDGTTPISRKMVSSANSGFHDPLVSQPIVIWNETVGSSITLTIETVTDNVTLQDDESWIEVEYLGTSGLPLSLRATDRVGIFGTPANQPTSSETWTTTGLGTPVKQALAVSITPEVKGPIKIWVCLAKSSTTAYFCPKVNVS